MRAMNESKTPILSASFWRKTCLWQALPGMTAKDIIRLVRSCSDNSSSPDNIYGYGIPDFWKAYLTGKGERGMKN